MLQYEEKTETLTVSPKGELDQCLAERIRNTIDAQILKSNAKTLIFDMNAVAFMDSSGIGMLIGRYKLMKRLNGKIFIRDMQPQVSRIFRMSGLNQIIREKKG